MKNGGFWFPEHRRCRGNRRLAALLLSLLAEAVHVGLAGLPTRLSVLPRPVAVTTPGIVTPLNVALRHPSPPSLARRLLPF